MGLSEHVRQLIERDGGLTVKVEWLGADGALIDGGAVETIVAEALATERAFAYIGVGGGRPHGQVIRRVLWEGDDEDDVVLVSTNRHVRLTIGIAWSGEHNSALERWREIPHDWVKPQLREFFQELQRAPDEPDRAAPQRQEFTTSWRARLGDDGELHTVGALLLTPGGELRYAAVDPSLDPSDIEAALRRGPPGDVFEYFVESGNGVSNEWSLPFTTSGPTVEFAAARLMTRLRFKGNPSAHLRELWLSGWPDTVDYALEEAEMLAAGADLADDALKYLARLRTARDEMRAHT